VDPDLERDNEQILSELAQSGLPIEDLTVLLQDIDYSEQVPILARWLERTENLDLKDAIVRALSVTWAKPAATGPLLREFGRLDLPWQYRWQVGSALEALDDRTIGEVLLPLVIDPGQGKAREMALIALGKTGLPAALDPLVAMLADAEVVGHAADALGRLGDPAAIPALERVDDDRDWVRTEAARAIRRLGRKAGRS
jgi:HEAT repeat protein